MMPESKRRELVKLLSALCDGPLSAEDHSRLESLFLAHPEALHDWLDLSRLHVEIELQVRAGLIRRHLVERVRNEARSDASSPTDVDHQLERGDHDVSEVPPRFIEQRSLPQVRVRGGHSRRAVRVCLAVATALALIAVGVQSIGSLSDVTDNQPPLASKPAVEPPTPSAASDGQDGGQVLRPKRRPAVVALLRETGPGGRDDSNAAIHRVFLAGEELELSSGQARLEMTGGASLLVESPAQLRFLSPEHVRLLGGSLSAQLPDWAKGFTVDTNAMRIVDLGTTFAVTADASDAAEAQVLQGMIKVQPRKNREGGLTGFLLKEGEAVRVDGLDQLRSAVDFGDARTRDRLKALSTSESLQPITTHNTGIGLQVGEEDPFWQVVAAPETVGSPRYAVVCTPHFRYSSNEPERSQWISVNVANDPVPNDSIYTFATSIDASGYRAGSIRVVGQVLADNGVREIRVNGVRVEMDEWINNFYRQEFGREEFHVVEIDSGFREGVNVIEFDVWNGGEYRGLDANPEAMRRVPNPMALRVEWQAFGRPLKQTGAWGATDRDE